MLVAGTIVTVLAYHGLFLLRITRLRHTNPETTAFIELRAEQAAVQGRYLKRQQTWVPYEQISPRLVRAVIAGEDLRFFRHTGIDLSAIRDAAQENLQEKRLARGASTINQQLAKNLFLSPSKNPLRKLHEALLALEMEQVLGERRVLEIYLNMIEWGDGIYGAEAAARHYFNTSASSLDAEQSAFLAAIIPYPLDNHDPAQPSPQVLERVSRIKALSCHFLLRHPLLNSSDCDKSPRA